ncbi:FxsA family protein, partial [Arthrospira platensis SPKY1]|nr:FxsA family protein [Arthrospira platensis SPKY1]
MIPLIALFELWLLIEIGSRIGVLATVGLVFLTGIIGVTLLRHQGFELLSNLQARLAAGEMPAMQLLEGVALLIGGFCLLTP